MAITTHVRISGRPPRLVGKPLEKNSDPNSLYQAEQVKKELQAYLRLLGEALDQTQVDVATVAAALNKSEGSTGIHPFLLMGA